MFVPQAIYYEKEGIKYAYSQGNISKDIKFIYIDNLEFKYFEFNKLVTNFWMIYEFLNRQYNVHITLKNKLFLKKSLETDIYVWCAAQIYPSYLNLVKKMEKTKRLIYKNGL